MRVARSLRAVVGAAVLAACASRPALPGPIEPLAPTPANAIPIAPPEVDEGDPTPPPTVRRFRLENGLVVVHVERPAWPLTAVYLVSAIAGEVYPPDQAGLSRLGNWSLARQLSRDLPGLRVASDTGAEAALIGAVVRPAEVRTLVMALGPAIARAAPSDRVIEEVRTAQLNALRDRHRSSIGAAETVAMQNLFGPRHHLAQSPMGNPDVVLDSTCDDVRRALAARWTPASSALVVVGDIDAATLDPLAAEAFAGFRERPAGDPRVPRATDPPPRSVLAFHDGDEAAYVLLTDRAPRSDEPDSLAFEVLMEVAAGAFTSRVNQRLRIQETITYGAYGSYQRSRFAGTYSIGLTVHAAEVDRALEILEQELVDLHASAPTEEEVERAKLRLESRLRESLDSNDSLAGRLAYGWVRGEPADALASAIEAIRAVRPRDVHAAARRWIRPHETPIIVAGDLNLVDPRRNLDHLGEVRIFTFEIEEE